MKYRFWLIFILLPLLSPCQSWKSKPFSVSIFNNATLLPPASLTAVFNQPTHLGVAVNYEFGWKETIRTPLFQNVNTYSLGGNKVYTGKWFQNIGLAWYNHQYVNHAFVLTTQAGYRLYVKKFTAELSLHAGAMGAFLHTEKFTRADGMWHKSIDPARLYLVGGAGIGIGYDAGYHFNMRRLFINYDFRLQMPFVKNYVPILPNGILSLGMQFTLFKNSVTPGKGVPTRLDCPKS